MGRNYLTVQTFNWTSSLQKGSQLEVESKFTAGGVGKSSTREVQPGVNSMRWIEQWAYDYVRLTRIRGGRTELDQPQKGSVPSPDGAHLSLLGIHSQPDGLHICLDTPVQSITACSSTAIAGQTKAMDFIIPCAFSLPKFKLFFLLVLLQNLLHWFHFLHFESGIYRLISLMTFLIHPYFCDATTRTPIHAPQLSV